MRPRVRPDELRAAVVAVEPWLAGTAAEPERAVIGAAVRLSLRTLAQVAPGGSVEVRVPPFAVVQCIAGPRHTRGTPPNVVQTDPATWLRLATGRLQWRDAVAEHLISVSGTRAGEVAAWLPVVRVGSP